MKKALALVLILGFEFETLAAGYGAAGCGLGSIVFEGKNQWYEQVMAATTNGIASQTFAITFGSLNCDANKLASKSDKAKIFISANKNSVINELAIGQGETVSVLSNIYSCSNDSNFGQIIKSKYSQVITGAEVSTEQIVDNINKVILDSKICGGDLS